MMLRILLLAALIGAWGGALHASDAINSPKGFVSNVVKQPHVTAELILESEKSYPSSGKPFDVILHLHMDEGWHTYWINPGDAGLATTIQWTLPPGFTAGPIQWPTPEKHAMGPLTTYGYGGDVYLLTTIDPPAKGADIPMSLEIKARADWLVCQEECIPGRGEFTVHGLTAIGGLFQSNAALFAAARARLPVPNTRWDVSARYDDKGLVLSFKDKSGDGTIPFNYFFAEQPNVLSVKDPTISGSDLHVAFQQNGEKPDHLSGVLVNEGSSEVKIMSVYLASFPVASAPTTTNAAPTTSSSNLAPTVVPSPAPQPYLLAVLGGAFLGGLILNLMPCVLPVLSLKVFSLIRHAGDDPRGAWRQGAAFTVGVVISFWALAGLLLALQATGKNLGWGFQMQSPGFVLALILLFFLLGLNLLGVFELGTSLAGIDAKAASRYYGLPSSFLNGALATVAATPCTAPFMGSSIGFAAQQPPLIALLIFTFLALGMATPYLLLTIFPGALKFVPKPGAWMEVLRQVMGFLLLATVIFLIYVFGALVDESVIPALLGVLLLAGLGAWIYGRWQSPVHAGAARAFAGLLAVLALGGSIAWGVMLAQEPPRPATATSADGWQPWSPEAVTAALKSGRPVFVDFTAAWCLSCKVNEQVALDVDEVRQAFRAKNVALFRGDWTHSDPTISATLRKYNRDGVPLYLLYAPGAPEAPQVLPEVLTPGIVLDALQKL